MAIWLLATRSQGKMDELVPMLAPHGISAVSLRERGIPIDAAEDDIESFLTFEENALAKARYFAARSAGPCLADDSGLCVDVLGGLPGVRSRRFARDRGYADIESVGEDRRNNDALLDACWNSGHAPPWRAHYACAMALVHGGTPIVVTARTHGAIVPDPAGVGGFGYDPCFFSDELQTTFGIASRDAKARVSHRGRAIAALLDAVSRDPALQRPS